MSLILEALKKSEQQRRLGEAPTFGTPAPLARRRRTLLPVLAVMIVAALGVGWWFRHAPSATNGAAPTQPTAAATATTPPVDATRGTPAHPQGRASPASPKPASPKPVAAKPVAPPPVAAPVLPMPTTDRPGSVAPLPAMPVGPGNAAATPGQAIASGPGAPHPAGPAVTGPATPAAAPPPTASAAATKPAASPADAAAKPPVASRPAPAAPPLPTMWDLPYSIRKDIPELALTMHVYSGQAADRFVVIKGEREVEGDDLGDGVMLREITPDGMVLEFKGQRFFYPRTGR
jgi:general secretion pathway protein B